MDVKKDQTASPLQCPTCRNGLNISRDVEQVDEKCPVCGSPISLFVFPRLFRESKPAGDSALVSEGEAACSFYPELLAEKVCDECGCLMSAKAAVRWGGDDLCLPCLHRLREMDKDRHFIARAKLYDNRALALVTWLAPFSLFTAPVALYLLYRHRKDKASFVPRGRWRWWLALILSVGFLVGWLILITVWASLIVDEFS